MWRKFAEEKPEKKTPVIVYREGFFMYLYNVCVYDGISTWFIIGVGAMPVFRFRARSEDYWMNVDECVPVPALTE